MTIKDFFTFKWFKKQLDTQFSAILPMNRFNLGAAAKEKKALQEYRNWVFASIQARAEAVGAIELRLFDGDEEKFEGDLLDLLFRVNPAMTKQDLFMGTQAYLDLDGNAFWFLARDKDGEGAIREIWLLRPDMVQIVPDKDNPLLVGGYIYNQSGQKISFKPNEILHFKNFNPQGNFPFPHRGLSIVEAASWSIDTDNEARQWNFSFFKNSARPDGILTKESQGILGDEEHRRIVRQWTQQFEGSLNAHKPLILSGGLKWEEMQKSQRDMDFIEQRRFSRDEILALFRVPKSVIGITEDVNRANAEAANFVFADRTVKPLMQKIVDTLNEFLVPEFGDNLFLDFNSPVPEDREQIVNEYTNGIDKWLTRNEIRRNEGLPPTRDGNRIFGVLNQIPIDQSTEEIKVQKPRMKYRRKKKKTGVEKTIDDFISKLPKEEEDKPTRELSELAISNYTQIWKQFFETQSQPFEEALIEFLSRQEKEVLDNIAEETKGLEPPEYSMKQGEDFLFSQPAALQAGIAVITPHIREWIGEAGGQAFLLTGAGGSFIADTEALEGFVEARAELFSRNFNQTTSERLLGEVQEGLRANETPAQLSGRISQFYDGERGFRAARAARTEASASANFAAQEAYKQAGVNRFRWLVVAPEDIDCELNANEVREEGQAFPSGDFRPPVHPNCVCTTLPVF